MTRRRPALITDAEASQDAQLRSRQIRYAAMMGIRVVCLIAAGVLVSVKAPLLWLWLPLCVAGMVFLPWMAVLVANDRPPKEGRRFSNVLRGRKGSRDAGPRPERQVSSDAPEQPAISDTRHKVIDAEQ